MTQDLVPPQPDQPAPDLTKLRTLFRRSGDIRSLGSNGLFILALLYTLHAARVFVVPVVMAALLNFLLRPTVRWLRRLRLPDAAGAAVVLAILLGGAGFAVYQLSEPASEWLAKAPQSLKKIESKVRKLRKPVEAMTQTAEQMEKITDVAGQKTPEVQIKGPTLSDALFGGTQDFLAGATIVMILLYFLLASGDLFLRKLVRVLPRAEDRETAVKVVREAEDQISAYLSTVTLIYAALGSAVGLVTWAFGMPNPLLWGVMAGLLGFVPYLGAMVGIAALTLASFLTFDDLGTALLVPAAYFVLAVVEGSFLTPMILGRRLLLNPVAVFISLTFWWWLWGIPGAILAVPMMAALKILCDHTETLAPIGEFLGR